jgi:hypothetical protein
MFVSLSSAITNETPAAFTAAGALGAMVAGLRHGFGDRRRLLALSGWVAAGVATKLTCLPLLPAALLALWWAPRRRVGVSPPAAVFLRQAAVVAGVCALLIGWWFVRNQIVYGDPLMAAAHQRMWSQAPSDPAAAAVAARLRARQMSRTPARFLWETALAGWQSFWGIFDGFSRMLPQSVYRAIALGQAAAVLGLVIAWRRGLLRGSLVRRRAAGVMLLFSGLLIVMFFVMNARVYSPQGRYLFPLLLPLGIAMALGWRALFPPRVRGAAAAAILLGLLLLNVYALIFMSVRPTAG